MNGSFSELLYSSLHCDLACDGIQEVSSFTRQYPLYPVQKPLRPLRSAVNMLPQLRPEY